MKIVVGENRKGHFVNIELGNRKFLRKECESGKEAIELANGLKRIIDYPIILAEERTVGCLRSI